MQIGCENARLKMLSELLSQVLLDHCFNVLRTQEQLGTSSDDNIYSCDPHVSLG